VPGKLGDGGGACRARAARIDAIRSAMARRSSGLASRVTCAGGRVAVAPAAGPALAGAPREDEGGACSACVELREAVFRYNTTHAIVMATAITAHNTRGFTLHR
jgi:hypothetical protein